MRRADKPRAQHDRARPRPRLALGPDRGAGGGGSQAVVAVALLDVLGPMFGHLPVVVEGPFFVAGVTVLVEADGDDFVEVAALDSLTLAAELGLARIFVVAATWWVAGAAPAEVTPRPIAAPSPAAVIASAASALRLLLVILFLLLLAGNADPGIGPAKTIRTPAPWRRPRTGAHPPGNPRAVPDPERPGRRRRKLSGCR